MEYSKEEKYVVNEKGEIPFVFTTADDEVLLVMISKPEWKPGNIVLMRENERLDIVDMLFQYGINGKVPELQSTRRTSA